MESRDTAGQRISLWSATTALRAGRSLQSDRHADVCIVGAGIAGLSVAYHLAEAGRHVIVLDDGPIGGGQTCRTTAHLSNAWDDRYSRLDHLLGPDASRIIAESHTTAINRIEAIVAAENIECDFERVDGFLFLAPEHTRDLLFNELTACHRAGLDDVQLLDESPHSALQLGPGLRFPRQGQFHPLKYLQGLAAAIERRGGEIYSGTHVTHVIDGRPAVETSSSATITAGDIVVATNTPINDQFAMHTKQAPYMTYVIGLRVLGDAIPRALFWDTGDPYHYVRTQTTPDGDILIVGGEDHKTGQADDGAARYARLEAFAREKFPGLGEVQIRWSGQVMEPIDGVAFIGRNPGDEHVYIVTGDSGMGMTHGTIAGMVIRDQILGRENAWAELYSPSRKTVRAAATFAKEMLNVAAQYGDYFTGSAVSDSDELAPGEAAVERQGLHRIAVYRDPEGTLHELSAVCPHLGCIVHWNSDDRTWDCPCHGSRFTCEGKVISGPANVDLAAVKHEVHH